MTKDPRRACGGFLCPHPPKAGILGARSANNGGILRQKSARVARKIGAPSARIPTPNGEPIGQGEGSRSVRRRFGHVTIIVDYQPRPSLSKLHGTLPMYIRLGRHHGR